MILLILITLGVAAFCFLNGCTLTGIVCLFGFSRHVGFVALVVTSIMLFVQGHSIVATFPLLLVGVNVFFLNVSKKRG